jgi:hypothetical protein
MKAELITELMAAHRSAQLSASSAREALSYAQQALRKAQAAADEADSAVAFIASAFKIMEGETFS